VLHLVSLRAQKAVFLSPHLYRSCTELGSRRSIGKISLDLREPDRRSKLTGEDAPAFSVLELEPAAFCVTGRG